MTDNATSANPGLPSPTPQTTRADHDRRRQACPETPASSRSRDSTAARAAPREDFLYAVKGGSLRSPPPPAAGGRKRPSSPAPQGTAEQRSTPWKRSAGAPLDLHREARRPHSPCAVAQSRRGRSSRARPRVRASVPLLVAPRPAAATMARWTTGSRSQPACSPAIRRSRASNSLARDPVERTRSCPTGTSPSRPRTSTPSRETCRRSSRPWTRLASNGNPWATSPCTSSCCAAPRRSSTSSYNSRRTPCPRCNPAGHAASHQHTLLGLDLVAYHEGLHRPQRSRRRAHAPAPSPALAAHGHQRGTPSIESAVEAFVARRNTLEEEFGLSVDRALENEVRQGIGRVLAARDSPTTARLAPPPGVRQVPRYAARLRRGPDGRHLTAPVASADRLGIPAAPEMQTRPATRTGTRARASSVRRHRRPGAELRCSAGPQPPRGRASGPADPSHPGGRRFDVTIATTRPGEKSNVTAPTAEPQNRSAEISAHPTAGRPRTTLHRRLCPQRRAPPATPRLIRTSAPGWTRTSDLRIRSPLLYPAELQGPGPKRSARRGGDPP